MGLSLKNTRSADFCADRIDVITNFAIITNAFIKRVHCIVISCLLWSPVLRERICSLWRGEAEKMAKFLLLKVYPCKCTESQNFEQWRRVKLDFCFSLCSCSVL